MDGVSEENDIIEMESLVEDNNCEDNEAENDKSEKDNVVEEPKVGMMFSSEKDVRDYYTNYARRKGFGIKKKTQIVRDDGVVKYFTLTCSREGMPKSVAKDSLKPHLSSKTNCLAKIRLSLQCDGLFRLTTVILEHNHLLSPTKTRFFRCNKKLDPHVKRRLEINDMAGIRPNKNFNSCVVEMGGYENLTFGEKDVRNHLNKARRLRLGMGDGEAIHNYFIRMQGVDSNFFYVMDLDEKSHLRNLFWADARSRATYEVFGDVITFDTTYLTNKYDMPFAPFVKTSYNDYCSKSNTRWYDKMCKKFFDIAAVAADFEEKCKIVMSDLDDLEAKVHVDETMCVKNKSTQIDLNALPNCADHEDDVISKENTKVLSPVAVRRKGHPSSKRKVSKVDQIVQRFKERKKKQHRAMPKAKMDSLKNGVKKGDHNEDMSASRRSMIATEVELQENPNIIIGDSSVDVSSQRSVNLMENQGFLSNGGVMVPRLSLNQLQNSSQQSWTGGPTQLWRDYYDVNNPSFARNTYWNGGSISGRVNMIDFMVNSSQTKSHHPT